MADDRTDPWEPTRRFLEALDRLREEEASRGPVKLYTFKDPSALRTPSGSRPEGAS